MVRKLDKLGGQEKLEHTLACPQASGGRHSGSATMGTFEQTRPMVAVRRSASPGPQWNTRPNTRTAAKRSGHRSSTTGVPFERGVGSMSKLSASEVAVRTTERAIHKMGRWGYITDHSVEKWYRDAKLHTIFEGTSEIQRVVISNALGTADGKPPLHVDLEPSGWPLNRMFGRGTLARTQVANSALAMRDRIPQPVMQLAMKVLRPPRK